MMTLGVYKFSTMTVSIMGLIATLGMMKPYECIMTLSKMTLKILTQSIIILTLWHSAY